MSIVTADLTKPRGDSIDVQIQLPGIDLTGAVIAATLKQKLDNAVNDNSAIWKTDLSPSSAAVSTDPTSGIANVHVDPGDDDTPGTYAALPDKIAYLDIEVTLKDAAYRYSHVLKINFTKDGTRRDEVPTSPTSPTSMPTPDMVLVLYPSGEVTIGTPDLVIPGATSTTTGGIKLTEDLGGTYGSPEVVSTHLTAPLPINQGGTASTTAPAALTELGAASSTALAAEISRAEGAEVTNVAAIASETTNRGAADTTLQTNINAESSNRASADTTLQSNITSEATTRATSDTTNANAIIAETNRAEAIETTLSSTITGEISRAEAAEALALLKSNNLSDITSAVTSRFNLQIALLSSVQAVAISNITLSGTQTIDGYTTIVGDEILCVNQTTASQNGPWIVASGAWTRPIDYPTGAHIKARWIQVNSGNTYANTAWQTTNPSPVTIDTASTVWNPVSTTTADFTVAPALSGKKANYYTDGVADEVQINAAITAAATLPGGGTVRLETGTYVLGASVIPLSNVWLRGAGKYSTHLTVASGATYPLLYDGGTYSVPSNPMTKSIVSDMELDGSNMLTSSQAKGFDGHGLVNSQIMNLYVHDTTATGLGFDYFDASIINGCTVMNCGYTNKHTITAASWSSNTITLTVTSHGYSVGSNIVVTGMTPSTYNGKYAVTTVIDANNFTIGTSNNGGSLQLNSNPGTATTLGNTSDFFIGHNGIGIASGGLAAEATLVTNNYCSGNQNDNFLIEADEPFTGLNASYIFTNNTSVIGGQGGFRNSGTINAQFDNNYDFGSLIGGHITSFNSQQALTAATWSGGVATYTTTTAHGYAAGQFVIVTNNTPTAYNGYFVIASVPTSTTFTVAMVSNPGTNTALGKSTYIIHPTYGTMWTNNIFSHNALYAFQIEPYSQGYTVRNNIMTYSGNYGAFIQSGTGSFTDNFVSFNAIEGVELMSNSGYVPLNNLDISRNYIYNNSQRNANNSDGLRIQSNSQGPIGNVTIHDNHIFDDQAVPTQRYAIAIPSGGANTNINISNNMLAGNVSGALNNQDSTSTSILIYNNVGLNPQGKANLGSISGSTTFDRSMASSFGGVLTGSITAVMPNSAVDGTTMTWTLQQGGSGSNTLTLPSNAVTAGTSGLTLSTTLNAVDTIVWNYDASTTKWREVSRALATANYLTSASTLSQRMNPRVSTLSAVSAVYTPNTDTTDLALINAPGANFTIANPTGTPADGNIFKLRLSSGSSAFTPTWGSAYISSGLATLPTSLPASKTVACAFEYDLSRTSWVLRAADAIGY